MNNNEIEENENQERIKEITNNIKSKKMNHIKFYILKMFLLMIIII